MRPPREIYLSQSKGPWADSRDFTVYTTTSCYAYDVVMGSLRVWLMQHQLQLLGEHSMVDFIRFDHYIQGNFI